MGIWAITLGAAVVIVLITRGRFFSLARIPVRAPLLLLVAAALQIGIVFVDFPEARIDDLGFGLLMLSYTLLLAFCFANLGLRGMGIITVGVAMNAVVIGLNQGMPATDEVWHDGELVSEPFEETVKHQPETDQDLAPFLSDIIVLPPPFEETISFGDIVLAVGFVDVVFWASRKRRRKTAEELEEERAEADAAAEPIIVEETIDLVEAEREEEFERETEPERESEPAMAGGERPRPISWRPPDEENVTIDLSAYDPPGTRAPADEASSGGDQGDAASAEHPLERSEHSSVVHIRRP